MYTVLDPHAYMYHRIMGRCSPGTGAIFVTANASVLQRGIHSLSNSWIHTFH